MDSHDLCPKEGRYIRVAEAWFEVTKMAARTIVCALDKEEMEEPLSFGQRVEIVSSVLRTHHSTLNSLALDVPQTKIPAARPGISAALRAEILERDDWRCLACGASEDLHMDHVVPVLRGGGTGAENLQTLCSTCNLKKGVEAVDYRIRA